MFTGIVTSKDCTRTKKILKKYKLEIDFVRCNDGILKGKPNPQKILNILREQKIPKKSTVYIGDMEVDRLTAKNAGVSYIHANYGYSEKEINSKYNVNSINEIIKNL